LSPLQERVLTVPEEHDLFLGGGRGGAKSYTLALLALRHVEQYRARARVLYVRQTHKGCADFAALCLDLFGTIYGRSLRWNAQEGVFRFPNGGTLEINQLEGPADYQKYQGRSFTLLLLDEAGQYAVPDLLDRLRSNLRGPQGMPLRTVLAANPGDAGHAWLARRYVFKAAPWAPFTDAASGRPFVYAPSTFLDNPFIDQAAYRRQLEAACPGDPELLRAWVEGDWAIARGAYFAGCLDEARNAVDPWPQVPDDWETYLGHDFGSSAPSVTYLVAKSPGDLGPDGRWYPRDSLVLVDELATNVPGELSKGMGYTVPILAEHIKDMCARWGARAAGCADDAIFAKTGSGAGSIAEEFARCGVRFTPARKADRLTGWTTLRRLLADAGQPDVPGLYVARHCEYFWATVPYLARDPRRAEDVDSRGPDHGADAARYSCLYVRRVAEQRDMYERRAYL
jgi:hypothetical protein